MEEKTLKPLSYSELSLWKKNREEWHKRYIEGIKEPPSYAMKRGTDIHRMLLQPDLWRLGKREQNYTPDEIRTHGKILYAFSNIPDFQGIKTEIKCEAIVSDIPTVGFWDGYKDKLLVEVKSGSAAWKESDAKNHSQLAFYALQGAATDRPIEECVLFTCSTANGKSIAYRFKLEQHLLDDTLNLMHEAKEWMESNNLWNKRA